MTSCGICKSEWTTVGIFISCFGCGKCFHNKCVNIKATVGDALKGADSNGLQWFCISCRKISTSRLFTKLLEYQKTADSINDLGTKLMDMIKQHRLDALNLNELVVQINTSKPGAETSSEIEIRKTRHRSKSTSSLPLNNNNPEIIIADHHLTTAIVQNSTNSSLLAASEVPGASSSSVQSLYPADVSEVSKPTNAVLMVEENRDNVNLSAELVVVKRPLRRSIFVSRLAANTSDYAINTFISGKLQMPEPATKCLLCHKFKFATERHIASFRITPPAEVFDKIVDKQFWAEGTLVREFIPRTNGNPVKKVPIPELPTSHPKND